MVSVGLRQSLLTVRFRPSDPTAIPDRDALDTAVAAASAAGLRVALAVYPYPPRELAAGVGSPAAFGEWVGALARRYPQVRRFVVGNEPNQSAFLRPQFAGGRNVSAAAAGRYLAAGYDALKAVDPGITVVGLGLSPRGNDDPHAPSNSSTSPLRFIAALGRWYRSSGRTAPLMDELSFHPYPRLALDPLERGYTWPNAGFVDLDRIRQGLWDAFHGTGQPTTVDGLRLSLDEVGWQVGTQGRPGYAGAENVPVTTEAAQARVYGSLVRLAACEPDVAAVNFFGFRDDGLRSGFQAGLFRADGSPRPSADAVRVAVAEAGRSCVARAPWQPRRGVTGAAVGGAALLAHTPVAAGTPLSLTASASAVEGATAQAFLQRAGPPAATRAGAPAPAARTVAASRTAVVHPPGGVRLRIDLPRGLAPGRYVVAVRLTAEGDRARASVALGVPFVVR
jgi:hypothetical protein